jgi:hypothetical protein
MYPLKFHFLDSHKCTKKLAYIRRLDYKTQTEKRFVLCWLLHWASELQQLPEFSHFIPLKTKNKLFFLRLHSDFIVAYITLITRGIWGGLCTFGTLKKHLDRETGPSFFNWLLSNLLPRSLHLHNGLHAPPHIHRHGNCGCELCAHNEPFLMLRVTKYFKTLHELKMFCIYVALLRVVRYVLTEV